MLVSMTGFGSASTRSSGYLISSEVKAVNNRYLKTTIKLPDGFTSLETKIDEAVHAMIARGSVNLTLRVVRETAGSDYEINFTALRRYIDEAARFKGDNAGLPELSGMGTLVEYMRLPGVIQDKSDSCADNLAETLWPSIRSNIEEALHALQKMREVEGASTQRYLADNIRLLRDSIDEVKRLASTAVDNYRERLAERVGKALEDASVDLDQPSFIREIAIFADRVDVSEEIARFYSHLDQFDATMENEKACGKKLDFLTQEMVRETNTIGSKANSPEILKHVVEMKSTIERVREMVQNVE
ncbi:MAG: YicC family protein [Thermoguttaceae bacterium]|nr:YicC family protein [Thermoguttaceae bacterium]